MYKLRIHNMIEASQANGPGMRAVIWLQGCSLGCPECFNPMTHPSTGGRMIPATMIVRHLCGLQGRIEGVTISGGEPLQQRRPLLELLQGIRRQTSLSVLLFSGYTWEEIRRIPTAPQLLQSVDILIAGRYDKEQRLAHGLVGSANQTIHFLSNRYSNDDLQTVPEAEVFITPGGEILATGISPLQWK